VHNLGQAKKQQLLSSHVPTLTIYLLVSPLRSPAPLSNGQPSTDQSAAPNVRKALLAPSWLWPLLCWHLHGSHKNRCPIQNLGWVEMQHRVAAGMTLMHPLQSFCHHCSGHKNQHGVHDLWQTKVCVWAVVHIWAMSHFDHLFVGISTKVTTTSNIVFATVVVSKCGPQWQQLSQATSPLSNNFSDISINVTTANVQCATIDRSICSQAAARLLVISQPQTFSPSISISDTNQLWVHNL